MQCKTSVTSTVSAFESTEPVSQSMITCSLYRALERRSASPIAAIQRASANNHAALGKALFLCCLAAAIEERPPADAVALFDGLSDTLLHQLNVTRALLTAVAVLREDRRPLMLLSAPERALVLKALRGAGHPGEALADEVEA